MYINEVGSYEILNYIMNKLVKLSYLSRIMVVILSFYRLSAYLGMKIISQIVIEFHLSILDRIFRYGLFISILIHHVF